MCRVSGSGGLSIAKRRSWALRGWVKNTDAGDVEIVAAGDAESLADLREELHKGSRGSRVDARDRT